MKTNRSVAIVVGVLYIIGTVAGILSVIVTGPVLDVPDYLNEVFAHQDQLIVGALLILTMGLALAMVPVLMFPILKQHSEPLALGYVVFRGALETFTDFGIVLSWLLLVSLSRGYAAAGAPDSPSYQALGALLLGADDWISQVTAIVFGLGALIFYTLLYQTRLIPRWISIWGLLAIVMHMVAGLLAMFGLITTFSTIQVVLNVPIALQEMVMAVWLIVKGFNPSAIASGSARADMN